MFVFNLVEFCYTATLYSLSNCDRAHAEQVHEQVHECVSCLLMFCTGEQKEATNYTHLRVTTEPDLRKRFERYGPLVDRAAVINLSAVQKFYFFGIGYI